MAASGLSVPALGRPRRIFQAAEPLFTELPPLGLKHGSDTLGEKGKDSDKELPGAKSAPGPNHTGSSLQEPSAQKRNVNLERSAFAGVT